MAPIIPFCYSPTVSDVLHFVVKFALLAPPILVAIILHEISHGMVANRLGDDTAKRAGRLTLNPLPHIDPFGSVLLPILLSVAGSPFLFGWAKPVPVNFRNLRNPKRDMVAVALAGPGTNVVLALLSAVAAHLFHAMGLGVLTAIAVVSVQINVALAVFNLTPILPLDGGRVLFGLLPREPAIAFARLEPYGMFIVMGLLFTGTLGAVLGPVTSFVIRTLL
jgi:Zn-dependent protease